MVLPTTTSTTTSSTTTTTTIPGCGTAGLFDSIACRIKALGDRVKSDVGPSPLRDNLLDALQGGLGNVGRAQNQPSGGNTRRTRLALDNADAISRSSSSA